MKIKKSIVFGIRSIMGEVLVQLSPKQLRNLSSLVCHAQQGDHLRGMQESSVDWRTKCGLVADSLLTSVFFSDEDDAGAHVVLSHADISKLKKIISTTRKGLVCKIAWQIWECQSYQSMINTGIISLPDWEHTYLIDIPLLRERDDLSPIYSIQAVAGVYQCMIQKHLSSWLWSHLDVLTQSFDRKTTMSGDFLNHWISDLVGCPAALQKTDQYVGQLISCSTYGYDSVSVVKRLREFIFI